MQSCLLQEQVFILKSEPKIIFLFNFLFSKGHEKFQEKEAFILNLQQGHKAACR